jgi:hypothetical protein
MSMTFFGAPTSDLLVVGAPSGIPAPFPALPPTVAHFRPIAPSVPPATFARAYRAATDALLGQKNHQKWCLNPGSVDLCNLSLFWRCTCTMLLPKRQIRRSKSRSEEITAVQASTHLRICLFANTLHALPRAAMVIHALPRVGRVFPRADIHRQHLPRALAPSGVTLPCAYWRV